MNKSTYEVLADCVPVSPPGCRVLDLGCGDGQLLSLVSRHRTARAFGIDISVEELRLARQLLGADVDLRCARAQSLPYGDDTFDVVLSHMVLMLLDDVETALAEVRRILRPGGLFASIVGGPIVPGDAFELFVQLFVRLAETNRRTHVRLGNPETRSPAGLRELFAACFSAPISVEDHIVSFDGTVGRVWETLARTYCPSFLTPAAIRELEACFLGEASALRGDNDLVPCSMLVRLVTVTA